MEATAMSVAGVGTDVCEIARIDAVWRRFGRGFLRRILTDKELAAETRWTAAKIARRWALKEAVSKACGTGIGGVVGFADIEVTYTAAGAPLVAVRGVAGKVWASVSDDAGVAMAFAVLERD